MHVGPYVGMLSWVVTGACHQEKLPLVFTRTWLLFSNEVNETALMHDESCSRQWGTGNTMQIQLFNKGKNKISPA